MKTLILALTVLFSSIGMAQVATPEICLVTVDPTYTFNQVVWEKDTVSTNIDHYNIYMALAGTPQFFLGSRDFDSSSVYEDHVNDPNVDSVTYFLTAVDTAGNESGFSDPHSTMHLWVTPNGTGGITCTWRHYWGKTVNAYECHRDTNITDNWEMIFSGGSGMTSWDDNDMPSTPGMEYKLMTTWSNVCSTQKAIGDFNSSRSNKTATISNPMDVPKLSFTINELYPNPAEDELNLEGLQNFGRITNAQIYDNQGKLIKEFDLEVNGEEFKIRLDVTDLKANNYLLVVNSTNGSYHQQFIKK